MSESINDVTGAIMDAAFKLHRKLGPGLSEDVYEIIMARDMTRTGLRVERQKYVSFDYEGMWFENAFRVDLFVEGKVIVELKSARALTTRDEKQLLTYLRIMDCPVGLLINFGAPLLKLGLRRIANGAIER